MFSNCPQVIHSLLNAAVSSMLWLSPKVEVQRKKKYHKIKNKSIGIIMWEQHVIEKPRTYWEHFMACCGPGLTNVSAKDSTTTIVGQAMRREIEECKNDTVTLLDLTGQDKSSSGTNWNVPLVGLTLMVPPLFI